MIGAKFSRSGLEDNSTPMINETELDGFAEALLRAYDSEKTHPPAPVAVRKAGSSPPPAPADTPPEDLELSAFTQAVERWITGEAETATLPACECAQPVPLHKKRRSWIGSVLFYFIIVGGVIFALAMGAGQNGSPHDIFGFSYFTVLTSSMQSEIPKGSLVLSQHVAPETLQVGDDITFFDPEQTSVTVTHKIIQVIPNFSDDKPGFQTKGVDNPAPDDFQVPADAVVGKVIFHVPDVGTALAIIQKNVLVVVVFFVILLGLSFSLQAIFKKSKK